MFWRFAENALWGGSFRQKYQFFYRIPKDLSLDPTKQNWNDTYPFSWQCYFEDVKVKEFNFNEAKRGKKEFTVEDWAWLARNENKEPAGYYGDFLPTGPYRVLLFVNWNKEIRVKECTIPKDPHTIRESPIYSDFLYSIPAKWHEEFFVLGAMPQLFFLTVSGKLHMWNNVGKESQKMETLWEDKSRPIQALITDAPAKKTWAFTGASAGQPAVYFEIKDDIKTLPYELDKIKEKNVPEAYKTVLEHARFLKKADKLQAAAK